MNKEIERIRNSIAHYEENGPYAETDPTLDDLCETLVHCEEIYESITITEMNALWFMRHITEPYANQSYANLLVGRMRERYEAAEARRQALREGRVPPEEPPQEPPQEQRKSYFETYFSNIENPLKERLQALAAHLEGWADGLELDPGEEIAGIGPIIALLRGTANLITEKAEEMEE